ncbi:S8 family serine peptidase [Virgibacillus xinjiangensis]|uniref:S8 family serine peptidase n=1 Tax=Virgibacillus xinjiangensis TaxID=393090 RepID=A0ABV7CTC2_9BACI
MGKKIAVVWMAVLLVLGNASVASAMGQVQQLNKQKPSISEDEWKETNDPDQEVRVIVEMDEEAPVEEATKQGVRYKDMEKSKKTGLERAAEAVQKNAKDKMRAKGLKAKFEQEFSAVVNGFSANVKQGDIQEIEEIPEVKAVHMVNTYERPIAEPDMISSKEIIEAQAAWRDFGHQGEGMVVGIIDTGIDPSHRDMVLSDGKTAELTEEFVQETVEEEELPGKYYTEKVPYGYNYMDGNDKIREVHSEASYHGMHVAGTVGANGDEDSGGIKGVAPEAQLLALKVFGNDPEFQSTYGDIYIKAIDDAIKLGADVVNMSLGSPSGFVSEESPEQQAVSRAVDNGVLMSISAGNSAMFGDGFFYPYASNPDYGVSGSPGLAEDSLQVASYENVWMEVDALEYSIDGSEERAAFLSASSTHPDDVEEKSFALVEAGLGSPEDFEGKDLTGSYALIQRGELAFTEKALNAQAAGAAGVIIYNNEDGIVNMATDPEITIPQLFMQKSDGDALAESLQNGEEVSITFTGEKTSIVNPEAGQMSAFTSWGLTPNLDFKPEITAPGGQIYSTLNDNEYGLMSGTSMAAPHVSGGGALVLERVDEDFGYDGADRVNLAKNLMMNTSEPVDFQGAPVSPRRQGAGIMQLHAALSTPVMVTEPETNEAKVALKEVTENEVSFELQAENFSDEAVEYEVEANAQTDAPVDGGGFMISAPNDIGAYELENAATVNKDSITVPAGGSANFTVTIDVSEWDESIRQYFTNGYWLEGFVTLTDPSDNHPQLTVPYAGFKGEWDAAPIFDTPLWDPMSYYGMTGVVTHLGEDSFGVLGAGEETVDPETIAFSPDGNGVKDDAGLAITLLRNAAELNVRVVDEDGNIVEHIAEEEFLAKDYYDSGLATHYKASTDWMWDGNIDGKPAPEGQYYLEAEAVIDYDGAEPQQIQLPVILDTTAPVVEADVNRGQRELSVEVADTDGGSGIASWDVIVDGSSALDEPLSGDATTHALDGIHPSQSVKVIATDHAGNVSEEVIMGPKGKAVGKGKGNGKGNK